MDFNELFIGRYANDRLSVCTCIDDLFPPVPDDFIALAEETGDGGEDFISAENIDGAAIIEAE